VNLPLRDRDLQRMDGLARVGVVGRGGVTHLADLYQRSPSKAMFPRIDGKDCREVVFLNTAGGIAGGDRLHYSLIAADGATITATTQTAERIYRAIGEPGHVTTSIEARGNATVEWLPQETIVFERARLARETHIHCDSASRVLAMDWLLLGRTASGETVATGDIRDDWRIHRDGRLVWADSFRLNGDIAGQTARASLLGGCTALATILYLAPDAADHLDRAREALDGLPVRAGATVVNGLLICRLAAPMHQSEHRQQTEFGKIDAQENADILGHERSECAKMPAGDLRRAVTSFLKTFRAQLGGFPPALPKVWAC
jgi:urease accessory protein